MTAAELEPHLGIARSEASRWGSLLEAEDLEQEGLLGLVRAAERFDPSRGVPFAAFARIYVRGAILEALRSRSARNRLRDGGFAQTVSLEFVDPPTREPDLSELVDQRDRLRLVAGLPERERRALIRTEVEGASLSEVAGEMGISENRVSQLKRSGTLRLRRRAA